MPPKNANQNGDEKRQSAVPRFEKSHRQFLFERGTRLLEIWIPDRIVVRQTTSRDSDCDLPGQGKRQADSEHRKGLKGVLPKRTVEAFKVQSSLFESEPRNHPSNPSKNGEQDSLVLEPTCQTESNSGQPSSSLGPDPKKVPSDHNAQSRH